MLLLRRAGPSSASRSTGEVKPFVFRLRTARGETSLSFYDSRDVSGVDVLEGAPGTGWGVAGITAGSVRRLGLEVTRDGPAGSGRLARAHVSATPSTVNREGQIPTSTLQGLALAAHWVIEPSP